MALAFLGNLMRPIGQMASPPSEPPAAELADVPSSESSINPRFCRFNPWLEAVASSATELARQSSTRTSPSSADAQLFSNLRSSSQALGTMSAAFSRTAALLEISEEQVIDRLLKNLSPPTNYHAKYQAFKEKVESRIAATYERRLEEASYDRRDAERKSSMLADAARTEIKNLQKSLREERRANSDLLLSLESLRSSGADTSALKTFLAQKLPSFQKEAYLDAKVCLLRKILVKYPDADMKYFLDMKEIPGSADPPAEWLATPKGKFAYVSSLTAPPILLNKRRRLQ